MIGLNIHQNYLKVMVSQFNEAKRSKDPDNELKVLERMSEATDSMSDFGIVEQKVRGGDMNWSVSTVVTIYIYIYTSRNPSLAYAFESDAHVY
jgi:hypothetical protein